ncbi:aspartate/glutamate racemase family protein [Bacillus solitudinis]|uniref:aspartate/glutamate racemase family protein n=1 Tax=Bacillus solitudinis TaxID=2014074 RepID=UPI001D0D53AB|nr:aspartate/glutamate racemase family protein [Bacillus solitudinis]
MMIYHANKGQVFYGHTIGILMLDTFVPMIPGDVGNATTFPYPVLYRTLKNITAKKMVAMDSSVLPELISKGKELVQDGAKAITGDCGFLLLYQKELRRALNVPVFLSSLLQLPFMLLMLDKEDKVGIVTADSTQLTDRVLEEVGIEKNRVKIGGLENTKHFYNACIAESGTLDYEKNEQEIITTTLNLIKEDKSIKIILLECSFLPPYSRTIQDKVKLPVFDFKTMIDYVHSSYLKPTYHGYL